MALNDSTTGLTHYLLRNEMGYTELEKRQLFLRSYQFSRKQSMAEKIKKSLFRVKRVIWVRFRSAMKLRRIVWFKLKNGLFFTSRRRRVSRSYNYRRFNGGGLGQESNSCFW